jgi:DNA-binding XRE family transcriptional regulator
MTVAEPLTDVVVLSRAAYDSLLDTVEEALDTRALANLRAREEAGEAEYVPIELADKIFAGEHPVRVWREYRGLTLSALAKTADIAPSYLSEIEAGKKPGSTRAMAAIARVLRVDIEDLLVPER